MKAHGAKYKEQTRSSQRNKEKREGEREGVPSSKRKRGPKKKRKRDPRDQEKGKGTSGAL